MGLNVSLETPVPASLQDLEPYGSLGGLRWKASATAAILIEFGKSPGEASAMLKAVVKLVGKSAAASGAVAKGNVMFYTFDIKLSSGQTSTVAGCLR